MPRKPKAETKPKKKGGRNRAYIPPPREPLPFHPKDRMPEEWTFFKNLDQNNPVHTLAYGCRVCGTITWQSFRQEAKLCVFHNRSLVSLKFDWFPNGVKIQRKRKPLPEDGLEFFRRWTAIPEDF